MNRDTFKGKWKQIQGELKKQWSDLTDDELKSAEGDYDKTVGLLQEKYGLAKDEAERKLDRLV